MTSPEGLTDDELGQARDLLDRRWREGAIDPGEHERRLTLLRHARTRGDLDAAVADLPPRGGATGPVLAGYEPPAGVRPAASAPPESHPQSPPESPPSPGSSTLTPDDRTHGLLRLDKRTAATVTGLTPLVCVLLFFAASVPWWIFLAIPIVGMVVYGRGDGERGDDCGERRPRR